jgi:acylphosphatase
MTEKMTGASPGAAARLLIEGRVQGVGYRYFALRVAREHGIVGWVRNLPDGRVEVEAAAGERTTLEAFIGRLQQGPPGGKVDQVHVLELDRTSGTDRFEIRA